MSGASKTQIDRLGERLRRGDMTEEDIRSLDAYRRSFADAYATVVQVIRDRLLLQPTGRPAKSTSSIVEKLRRESIRLSQMQDIAGCRLVVNDVATQEDVVERLRGVFGGAQVIDRRQRPSHGYRAIHVVVAVQGRSVEIQVRTSLQHTWAELSEKLSDVVDAAIKYGGGNEEAREALARGSELIARLESLEGSAASPIDERAVPALKEELILGLRTVIAELERHREERDAVSD